MRGSTILLIGLVSLSFTELGAQNATVTGDRSTPLQPLITPGNVGVSNAVLRDQPEVRALWVVVEPGGMRVLHSHHDVDFHLFVPITGVMTLDLDGGQSVNLPPWQPYYLDAGTLHGFRNNGSSSFDIMEIFVR